MEPWLADEDVAVDAFSDDPDDPDEEGAPVLDSPDDEPVDEAEESEPLDPEDFASERESLR